MFDAGTWTCHVCGRERPDALISVFSRQGKVGGVEMQQNVRYCNDTASCVEEAPGISFLGGLAG